MLSNEEFEEVVKDFVKGHVAVHFAFIEMGAKVKDLQEENGKLRELLKELYPFVGNACPDDCKHREECEGEGNRGAHGFPLVCVAYNRYFEELSNLGIEGLEHPDCGGN